MKKKLIVIVGPTASGKTKLSLQLAKKFNGYIISADSKQVYAGMDIGTGKITQEEQENIPHFGLDIVQPDQDFNVSHFKTYAESIIKSHPGLPILVGGTGLFVDSLIHNITPPQVTPDPVFRNKIEEQITDKGLDSVVQELTLLDPEAKNVVDLKNPRRVIRALEVCVKTGKPFSSFYEKGPEKYDALFLGIAIEKELLHKKIDTRINSMIKNGLIDETKNLLKQYPKTIPAMLSLGYRQLIPYLEGVISKEQAIDDIKSETKKYAKRQMTWFKKNKNIVWISDTAQAIEHTQEFLQK